MGGSTPVGAVGSSNPGAKFYLGRSAFYRANVNENSPLPTLRPCRRRNCVSSQETREPYRIEPLGFTGSPDQAWQRLLDLLRDWPRTQLFEVDGTQARARFRSRIFHFPDDAHFVLDREGQTIHFRSAARWGRRDFDVNRRRIEAIRIAFTNSAT